MVVKIIIIIIKKGVNNNIFHIIVNITKFKGISKKIVLHIFKLAKKWFIQYLKSY